MGDVRLLESVQRRWTREIFGIGHFSYVERLKNLVSIQFMLDVFGLICISVGKYFTVKTTLICGTFCH